MKNEKTYKQKIEAFVSEIEKKANRDSPDYRQIVLFFIMKGCIQKNIWLPLMLVDQFEKLGATFGENVYKDIYEYTQTIDLSKFELLNLTKDETE